MMTGIEAAGGNGAADLRSLAGKELRREYVIHRDGTYLHFLRRVF